MRPQLALCLPLMTALVGCGTTSDAATPEGSSNPTEAVSTTPDAAPAPEAASSPAADAVYAIEASALTGEAMPLSSLQGKVTVFVNVASKCGYTPQYAGLQKLQEELGGEDFTVVGVPSNDFGGQEPGSAEEIQAFCQDNYGVTFPMLAKMGTKEGDSPLFDELAALTGGDRPNWNFCKYVVSKDGTQARFFKSGAGPESSALREAIAEFRAQ